MKKLLTIALCVILVGVMSVSAFASAFELGDYGQLTITLTEGATTPVADGTIAEGEYEYGIAATEASEAVYLAGESALADTTYVNFYLAVDADYIYVATETDDTEIVDWQEGIFVNFCLENTGTAVKIFASDCGDPEVLSDDRANWAAYFAGNSRTVVDGVTTTEVVFSRAKIAEFLGVDSFDKIAISISQNTNCAADSAVVWGFQNAEAEALGYPAYGYPTWGLPHVVEIIAEPVVNDTDPAETTPADENEGVLDGGSDIEVDGATDPVETEPSENEPTETDPATTPETEPAAEGGCGASVAAACVAMLATLGTCVVFVTKK